MNDYQHNKEDIPSIKDKLTKIEELLVNISNNSQLTTQLTVLLAKNQLLLMNNDENLKNSIENILEMLPETMKSAVVQLKSIENDIDKIEVETSLQEEDNQIISKKKEEKLISPELASFYQENEQETEVRLKRLSDYKDEWGFINNFRSTLESYEHLTHLLFSKFFYEIVVEIHHYNYEDKKLQDQINETTTEELQKASLKLIKEAPTSQILQRLYRNRIIQKKIALEEEYNLLTHEYNFIKEVVHNFYSIIIKNLDSSDYELRTYKVRVRNLIDTFSLGAASLETRIILAIYSSSKQLWNQINTIEDSQRELLIVKMATLELILIVTRYIRKNPRFRELLTDMKA